eukprot:m.234312 g.234312  ORF g.234312 m.234312 type:complete len:607 (-) comp33654_c3_seq1:69-1889(-)
MLSDNMEATVEELCSDLIAGLKSLNVNADDTGDAMVNTPITPESFESQLMALARHHDEEEPTSTFSPLDSFLVDADHNSDGLQGLCSDLLTALGSDPSCNSNATTPPTHTNWLNHENIDVDSVTNDLDNPGVGLQGLCSELLGALALDPSFESATPAHDGHSPTDHNSSEQDDLEAALTADFFDSTVGETFATPSSATTPATQLELLCGNLLSALKSEPEETWGQNIDVPSQPTIIREVHTRCNDDDGDHDDGADNDNVSERMAMSLVGIASTQHDIEEELGKLQLRIHALTSRIETVHMRRQPHPHVGHPVIIADWMPFAHDARRREKFAKDWQQVEAFRSTAHFLVGKEVLTRTTQTFNTNQYKLRETLATALGEHVDQLNSIHTRWASFSEDSPNREEKEKLLAPLLDESTRAAFQREYDRFMLEVVCPNAAEASGKDTHATHNVVYFQSFPCLRVQLPALFANLRPHVDAMYNHPPSGLHYYLPLTPHIHDTGTLQLETSPGANDFEPLELHYGEYARFAGSILAHYTVGNRTGKTRMSIDCRAVVPELLDEHSAAHYKAGEYYSVATRTHGDTTFTLTTHGSVSGQHGFPFVFTAPRKPIK